MFLERFKTPSLAHVAYLLGDRGEAILVDPRRDIEDYLQAARDREVSIRYVLETHRQEDFVIGSSAVAARTGARVVSLRHPLFGHSDVQLADGEELRCAGFRLQVLHTPGHTPESCCYSVTVAEGGKRVWGVFTGDTLFVGDTGRTDLADPMQTRANAERLYDAIHSKLLPLGDQTLIFPAHGAGSVCGGNIAAREESTLGFERGVNPVFTRSREQFAEEKVRERLPRPPYFSLMEQLNLGGGRPMPQGPGPFLSPDELEKRRDEGVVIDVREPEAFAGGHVPGSLNLWFGGLGVFAGWVADDQGPVFLVLESVAQLEPATLALARLGVDHVAGVLRGGFSAWRRSGKAIARSGTVSAAELRERLGDVVVLDVRDDEEFETQGHIPDSLHLYVGYVERELARIKPALEAKREVVVTCSVGHRAGLAVSMLRRQGFSCVQNLLGGMTAWQRLELPTKQGADRSVSTIDVEGPRR